MPVAVSGVGAGPETVRLARADAITHREALEAAGIDANSPGEVFRRLCCRGTRARNIALLLSAVLISTMAITMRTTDGRSKYLYAPSGAAYADDAHLESHHWTHFRHGAPVIVVARDMDDLMRRTALFAAEEDSARYVLKAGEEGRGTTRLFRRLLTCLGDPSAVVNQSRVGDAKDNDENGFATSGGGGGGSAGGRQRDLIHDDHASIGNIRVAVDPAVFDPNARGVLHAQQQQGRHITRGLQWDRTIFVVTNVSAGAESPAVQCLTYLRASAVFQLVSPTTGAGDWVSSHDGLYPPVATHHIGVALPRRRSVSADAAAAGAAKAQVLTRFHLLLAPTGIRPNAVGVSAEARDASALAVHGFAWWAAQRIKHTPADDAIVAITPPGARAGKAADYSALDDAIMSRWYHEHHSEHAASGFFKPPPEIEAPKVAGDGDAAEVRKDAAASNHSAIVNPALPALTVELTSELQVVGPVTVLHEGTQPSTVPLVMVVRPDGLGVYRAIHAKAPDLGDSVPAAETSSAPKSSSSSDEGTAPSTTAAAAGAAAAAAGAAAVVGRRRLPEQ